MADEPGLDRNRNRANDKDGLHLRLLELPGNGEASTSDIVDSNSLAAELWDGRACGPQAQDQPDFSAARPADLQAQRHWTAIDGSRGIDLSQTNPDPKAVFDYVRLVNAYRLTLMRPAATKRLEVIEAAGGLGNRQISNNVKDNLCTLGDLDPRKATRAIPVVLPEPDSHEAVYFNADMQRSLLAYHTITDQTQSVFIGNQKVKLIDIEMAVNAGAVVDDTVTKKLHQAAIAGLEGPKGIFDPNRPYDAAERQRIAARPELGLNEAEVDWLHDRLLKAKDYLNPKNP